MGTKGIRVAVTLATLAGTAGVAWSANMALKAPTSLEQAVRDGQWVFNHESFGSSRSWIPDGAFHGRSMTCAVCHGDGMDTGRTPDGMALPSLAGTAARYPELRGGTVVTFEQQVARCIARGVGGRPPATGNPAMVDLIAYLTALSRTAPLAPQLPAVWQGNRRHAGVVVADGRANHEAVGPRDIPPDPPPPRDRIADRRQMQVHASVPGIGKASDAHPLIVAPGL